MIGLYKTEVIQRRGPWRQLDAVEFATLEWVDWFNNRRLREPIGYVPPAESKSAIVQQGLTQLTRSATKPIWFKLRTCCTQVTTTSGARARLAR